MVKRARYGVKVLVAAVAVLAVVLTAPRAAEAAIYVWNVNADGSWTTASNWLYAGGGTNTGYPNGVGDQAFFTGTYTGAGRTVTIPANAFITVGAIYFGADVPVSIVGGLGARLFLDNGASSAQLVATTDELYSIRLNLELRGPLLANVAGALLVDRLIESGTGRAVTKRGSGSLTLQYDSSYSGGTRVEQGVFQIYGGLRGNLEVGTGSASSSATFYSDGQDQFQPTAAIEVRAGGHLVLRNPQRAGRLRITDGFATLGPEVTVQELTMVGGICQTYGFTPPALITATSSAQGPAVLRPWAPPVGPMILAQPTTFMVADGPGPIDLVLTVPLSGTGDLVKDGAGWMSLGGTERYDHGRTQVRGGVLDVVTPQTVVAIPGPLEVGFGTQFAGVVVENAFTLAQASDVVLGPGGALEWLPGDGEVRSLDVQPLAEVLVSAAGALTTGTLRMSGGRIRLYAANSRLRVRSRIDATSMAMGDIPTIEGGGTLVIEPPGLAAATVPLRVTDGPQPIDLHVGTAIWAPSPSPITLVKSGSGVVRLAGVLDANPIAEVADGSVLVTGEVRHAPRVTGGLLGGTGTVRGLQLESGRLAPGLSPGRLTSTGTTALDGTFEIELNGTQAGTDYDQLDVRGSVDLQSPTLSASVGFAPVQDTTFVIIANDGTDPVTGTFADLPEGGTLRAGSQRFKVSYRGGDGNDVVLTATTQMTYYLAEGATGGFFDDDVLIANPGDRQAPITLTFLKEGGDTIVSRRVVPAMGRLTVAVDQIPGLESTAASVQVVSDDRLPLIVERSMFWDASYYGGHTANAVTQPETRWIFAEGFQGFFDTYILIANAEATPTSATLTFLREGAAPVVATVPVGAFSRKTVYAGDYPELKDRGFGIVVESTQPVIAERAMYFASQPGRLWAGGHANTGTVAPSRSWFHAEGATGGYFSTFILLSNPQITPAQVTLRFLLPNGDVITRTKTLAAQQRMTVNPAGESDPRLQNAAVSTVVESDVPIVSERSMYWPGEAAPFGEGHNSSGIASLATRWGLAEGRIGGPHGFDTFILLANPSATPAQVTITYLRDTGPPIVRTYAVPATSRFNVDVKSSVPELRDTTFGARIEVTNAVPIAVERSLYWNANGVFWAGGSNALGTPLP